MGLRIDNQSGNSFCVIHGLWTFNSVATVKITLDLQKKISSNINNYRVKQGYSRLVHTNANLPYHPGWKCTFRPHQFADGKGHFLSVNNSSSYNNMQYANFAYSAWKCTLKTSSLQLKKALRERAKPSQNVL